MPVVPVSNPGTGSASGGGTGGAGTSGGGDSNPSLPQTIFFPDTVAAVPGQLTAPCPAAGPAVCNVTPAPAAPGAPTAPAAPAAPPPPSPAQLAQQAYSQIRLNKPAIGSAPCTAAGCMGAVGVPVWLWTQPWAPQAATAAVGGVAVTVNAKISNVTWSMGDGHTVVCNGAGTAFNEAMGFRDSPDCGYRYSQPSRNQPGGKYPVTATATWTVQWTGAFNAATTVTTASTVQVAIGEYQSLIQVG